MEELRTWSYTEAIDAHAVLDTLEAAEAEAHQRAQDQADRSARTPFDANR